ncbi:MAG: hypothetical protein KC620_25700, partial [Myxococcales bacterium]|nr:hypothetical protein [Myxococcales bacterium]
ILLYNLARASEEMGDPEQAITHYKTYLARIPQNAEDRGEVETRVRVMEKTVQAARLARITIQGVPVGAKVLIDEQPAEDPIDGAYRVEPGAHRVQVVTPDHVWAHEVTLAAGQPITLTYEAAPAPPPPPPPPSGPSTQALVGYITGGVGAASLIIGGVFWGQAQSAVDDYDAAKAAILRGGDRAALDALAVKKQNAQDDAESSATAAYVFWGIGGAALAAGSALVVLDLLGMPVLDMAVVPTAGGIGVAGTF